MYPSLKFSKNDPAQFFNTLRNRVNDYFQENNLSRNANWKMVAKTISMFAIYLVPYGLLVSGAVEGWYTLLLWAIMGFGLSGIGLSVMHDANHSSYSTKGWINNLLSHSMDFIGGSSFTWKVQHNLFHHTYTNIYEMDEDIHDKPILRLSPHGALKKIHRYQHLYAPLLYTLATLGWVLNKDIEQLKKYEEKGLIKQAGSTYRAEMSKLIGWKIFFYSYILVIPIIFAANPWWMNIIGLLILLLISGFVTTVIFQLAHVVEGPTHHLPAECGTMENTWAIHQLNTTANFARKNPLISWYVGGLNFQVEHHLFPNICHVHYKKISEIVKATAQEFNLPYHEYPTLLSALGSHLRTLKKFGQPETA